LRTNLERKHGVILDENHQEEIINEKCDKHSDGVV